MCYSLGKKQREVNNKEVEKELSDKYIPKKAGVATFISGKTTFT